MRAGPAEISFYDSLGMHLTTVGGEGEGPGEFRGVMQIHRLPGDTLLVLSYRPGLTWLSPQGDYLRSEKVNLNEVARLPCRIGEGNWNVLGDGTLLTVLADDFGFDTLGRSAPSTGGQAGRGPPVRTSRRDRADRESLPLPGTLSPLRTAPGRRGRIPVGDGLPGPPGAHLVMEARN